MQEAGRVNLILQWWFNPFQANVFFAYPLKISENLKYSYIICSNLKPQMFSGIVEI